jgi:L-cysteine desulfidase
LQEIQPEDIYKAKDMIQRNLVDVKIDEDKKDLFIDAEVHLRNGNKINSIVEKAHSNLISIILNGDIPLYNIQYDESLNDSHYYEELLENSSIDELIKMAKAIDEEDIQYIKR